MVQLFQVYILSSIQEEKLIKTHKIRKKYILWKNEWKCLLPYALYIKLSKSYISRLTQGHKKSHNSVMVKPNFINFVSKDAQVYIKQNHEVARHKTQWFQFSIKY